MALRHLVAALALACCTCSPSGSLVSQRPYSLEVPTSYDAAKAVPLVVLLHGYMDSGPGINRYFELRTLVNDRGFLLAYPNGTVDSVGNKFWNATDACCNYEFSRVDDVAYLTAVLDDATARYNVDRERIFLVGHSNGGFMANRLACELSPRIAAFVTLAGPGWFEAARCQTTSPVSILHIHGDADDNVFFDGGTRHSVPYPSAPASVAGWATRNGCTGPTTHTPALLDLDSEVPGAETGITATSGCPDGGAAELWTVRGGGHKPALQPTVPGLLYEWLLAHPKPQ